MKEIIIKYLEDSAADAEKEELMLWLRNKKNRLDFTNQRIEWQKSLDSESYPGGGEVTWNKIQTGLMEKSYWGWQKSRVISQYLRYAAIFFFLTTIGSIAWQLVLKPGSNSELVSRIIADKGQISKVELPDGSFVWLNSGSSLTYNGGFGAENREVSLYGEGYFEIFRNEKLPLTVDCGELKVKVTGTKFNINISLVNNKTSVALEEGEVMLLSQSSKTGPTLKPGQMAEFDPSVKSLIVKEVNVGKHTAWKEGVINFYDQSLEEILEKLKLRYNQEFVLSEGAKAYRYTFSIRNESLHDVISLIQKITPIKAKQNGNLIEIEVDNEKIKRMDK